MVGDGRQKKAAAAPLTGRLLAELAVIVLGVLIALAVDNWWTERGERAEEAEILRALADDLESSKDLLAEALERQGRLLQDIRVLSGGSFGEASELDDAGLNRMVWRALWEMFLDTPVEMSAYEEIKNSGRLRLLEDPELRRSLAKYDRLSERIAKDYDDVFQHQTTKMDPYAIASLRLAQFSSTALEPLENAIPLETPFTDENYRPLLDSETFQNLIASKYYIQSGAEDRRKELLKLLAELEMRTEARLNELQN
jgi:hypothetical protein